MIIIDKGSLSQALRASSSVTFLLEPVEVDSMLLVDGGLVANVPTKAAHELNSDYKIAVDATSQLRKKDDLDTPLKIADQIVSIPMNLVTEQDLKYADIIIAPKLGERQNDDFSSLDSLITLGYEATIKKIDLIKNDILKYEEKNSCDTLLYYSNLIPFDKNSEIEKRIFNQLHKSNKISSQDILTSISKEYKRNIYSDISALLISKNDTTQLKINYKLKPIIKNIDILGASKKNRGNISSFMNPLLTTAYCGKNIVEYLVKILSYYRNIGYPFAEIEKIAFNNKTQTLSVTIDEGIVNKIVVSGNKRSKTPLIIRELEIKEGEYLTSAKLSKSLKNLRTTGLFTSVDINIKKENNNNILEITVEDKLTEVARFGMKIDNERFFQVSVDVRNENVLGSGTELGAYFFGGIRNQLVIAEHIANRIFDTYLTYKIKGYYDSRDIYTYSDVPQTNPNKFIRKNSGEYRQILFGGSLGVGIQAEKFGNLIAEFRYEQNRIFNLTNNVITPYKINIAALKFSMKIDTQDKYPYPTTGTLLHTFYETSQKFLGADESYIKYALEYKGYFSFNKSHTIIPKFEIGFADETLPLSQQFAFGGQFSFWGYREYEYRGRQIIIASLAYRYKLPFKLWFDTYISARYNTGSIWEREEEMKFKNFKHAAGIMISWDTPIGPADLGAGKSFEVDKNLDNILVKGETLIYFAIGYFF
jgi:outer membrane protein assembly factor BamA